MNNQDNNTTDKTTSSEEENIDIEESTEQVEVLSEEIKEENILVEECSVDELKKQLLEAEIKIHELEKEISFLNKSNEVFKQTQNEKFLELIEKKSTEASEILKNKQIELEEKLLKEFNDKKDYIYEHQFSSLVEIVSQFEKVLSFPNDNKEIQNYLFGFQMFITQFKELFVELNIEEINPKINEVFDPVCMQAISTEESEEDKKNKILEIFRPGFKLKKRIIKLAEVKVGI